MVDPTLGKSACEQGGPVCIHLFPFSVIGATGGELPNWVQGYEGFWKAKVKEAEAAGDKKNY